MGAQQRVHRRAGGRAETAEDPAKLEQVRASMARWLKERDATDAELEGIARASGVDPD
ncbi:hypothetical protein [Streptomyces smyrnaeus]|uniref:hypothetical protein n=1 Tax=Streptomyces smyrnaeus TaxID=1387713 RepID=UPI0033C6AEDA